MTSSLTSPEVCKHLIAKKKFKPILCKFCRKDASRCEILKSWEEDRLAVSEGLDERREFIKDESLSLHTSE